MFKAVHQQAAGIVGGGLQRPAHKGRPLGCQPAFRGIQQGMGGLAVIFAFKKAEGAAGFTCVCIVFIVNNGGYAPHGPSVAQGQKKPGAGAFPKGVLPRREQLPPLTLYGRVPQGALSITAAVEGS